MSFGGGVDMKYLESINVFLNRLLLILGGIAVILLMSLATLNVVLRIFHIPYSGTYEIVSFLGAIVIAFALGYTQKRKDHIIVDILTERFSKQTNRVLNIVSYGITMVFFAVVSWQIFIFGMKIWKSGEVSETLKIVYHPFIFCVSVGFAVLSLTIVIDFLKTIFMQEEK
jgi:TRAP-type C4-dicarboxylate transport system permease small subunit